MFIAQMPHSAVEDMLAPVPSPLPVQSPVTHSFVDDTDFANHFNANKSKRSRSWVFTLNNYTEIEYLKLTSYPCKYVIIGKEVAPTTLTPHLQGYLHFANAKMFSVLHKEFPRVWFQIARGSGPQNQLYCRKGGLFFEEGICPLDARTASAKGGEANAERYLVARDLAIEGRFLEIDADIYVKCNSGLLSINKHHALMPDDANGVTGQWFYGKSGTGKSKTARLEFPDYYLKNCNKWWDGYNGEESVIIDDFDKIHDKLGHHLKIWADRYAFKGEIKGGAVNLRPSNIVVTSNYHPSQIWTDEQTVEPILRRFKIVYFKNLEEIDDGLYLNQDTRIIQVWFLIYLCNLNYY
jgi:hypothetical protein